VPSSRAPKPQSEEPPRSKSFRLRREDSPRTGGGHDAAPREHRLPGQDEPVDAARADLHAGASLVEPDPDGGQGFSHLGVDLLANGGHLLRRPRGGSETKIN